jgi:hypothetical protein
VVARRVNRVGQVDERHRGPGFSAPQPVARQESDGVKKAEAEGRRDDRGGKDPELGLVQDLAGVAQLGDEQRHGEADAGHRRRGDQRRPPDRQPRAAEPRPGRQPCPRGNAERLADDQAEHDRQHEARADRVPQQVPAQIKPGIGQREQRDDHEAAPWMERMLEPVVRRQ